MTFGSVSSIIIIYKSPHLNLLMDLTHNKDKQDEWNVKQGQSF